MAMFITNVEILGIRIITIRYPALCMAEQGILTEEKTQCS
jgi:hypothetical protein